MVRVEMVPVRHRRLGVFFAPEPRHPGGAAAPAVEWNLEGYQLAPRGTKIIRAGAGRRLRAAERLAIKSEADGEPRFLPDVLALLHRGGEVPPEALPGLLHLLGPTLGRHRHDFEPVLAHSRAWRTVALLGLALLALLGLAGAALRLPGPVRAAAFGPGGGDGGPIRVLSVDGLTWLAAPMRVDTFLAHGRPHPGPGHGRAARWLRAAPGPVRPDAPAWRRPQPARLHPGAHRGDGRRPGRG